jgi:hypothetical protein
MKDTTQNQLQPEATTAPGPPTLSVDDQVKLAAMKRENDKNDVVVKGLTHNAQNGRLEWMERALRPNSLGATLFTGNEQAALLKRYGRMLLKFTRIDDEQDIAWPE